MEIDDKIATLSLQVQTLKDPFILKQGLDFKS